MNYIRLDCPKCKKIHSLIFKANNICKCPSCLHEFEMDDLIEQQLINVGRKKRHLSTFAEQKQHNSSSKKDCCTFDGLKNLLNCSTCSLRETCKIFRKCSPS